MMQFTTKDGKTVILNSSETKILLGWLEEDPNHLNDLRAMGQLPPSTTYTAAKPPEQHSGGQ